MLNVLSEIIENGNYLSPTTLRTISIREMNMSDDGRDINIHYGLFNSEIKPKPVFQNAGFREDTDLDDVFFDMSKEGCEMGLRLEVENQRFHNERRKQGAYTPRIENLEVLDR